MCSQPLPHCFFRLIEEDDIKDFLLKDSCILQRSASPICINMVGDSRDGAGEGPGTHEDILYTGVQPQKTWDETQRDYYGQVHGENPRYCQVIGWCHLHATHTRMYTRPLRDNCHCNITECRTPPFACPHLILHILSVFLGYIEGRGKTPLLTDLANCELLDQFFT